MTKWKTIRCWSSRLIDEINIGNPYAFATFMAPDVMTTFDSAEQPVKGIGPLDKDLGLLRSAFHDLHLEIETIAAYHDKVAVRLRYSGHARRGIYGRARQRQGLSLDRDDH